MAERMRRGAPATKQYSVLLIKRLPLLAPAAIAFVFIMFFILPAATRFLAVSQSIRQKQNDMVAAERSSADVARLKGDLEKLRKKVIEFKSRLPKRMETTLIIETLQGITEKSKLKFSSLNPLSSKKHKVEGADDVFVELPIRVKLSCDYNDLIEFLKKIETSGELMRVSDLSIRANPATNWEHMIELSISAYSQGDSGE